MRWPWSKRDDDKPVDEALAAAEERYEKAKQMRPETERVAELHRQLRRHNHFADAIGHAFRDSR
jgi:hypothetical protein